MTDSPDDFNRFERSMWEQRAADYAESFERVTAFTIDALLDAAAVHTGTELLDVGTGPGYVAAAAVSRGASVSGIDIADAMVELAQARVPSGRFERASAEELPRPDDSCDAVVGNFVLLHLGHPDRALAETRRVLRPGGRVAFTLWEPPAGKGAFGVIAAAIDEVGVDPATVMPSGPTETRDADRDAIAALFGSAELESITFARVATTLRVDPGRWWESVMRSTPRTGSLIGRQTPRVQAAIRARYDALVAPYADGPDVVLPVAAVVASAVAPSA